MLTSDFDYELPEDRIAQAPAARREDSRLMVLDRGCRTITNRVFGDLVDYLRAGDVLVLNDSRVLPARLRGCKAGTRGEMEALLVEEKERNEWWVMLRPGKRARAGSRIVFWDRSGADTGLEGMVVEKSAEGLYRVRFNGDVLTALEEVGEVPLPPYIRRSAMSGGVDDRERYQTVYGRVLGSVAAPTAGLHFSEAMLRRVEGVGVEVRPVTLHVGLGTFAPVKADRVEAHVMHEERYEVGEATAAAIRSAKREGRRVLAVGTTTVRVLESVAAQHGGEMRAMEGRTRIFIYPPYKFQVADGLLTNFHLPQSTLLMLVCAFASPGGSDGRDWVLGAYAAAVREKYRFFSYGDAMLIL